MVGKIAVAVAAPDANVLARLRALGRKGYVVARKVERVRRTKDGKIETIAGTARVVWMLPASPIEHARDALPSVAPPSTPARQQPRPAGRNVSPHASEKPEPLEILARLAGRTTFVLKGTPTGATPITPLDVAHALAASEDKLGAAMGMAIACQRTVEWPVVHKLALPRVIAYLRGQRKIPTIIEGPRRFLARLALRAAFERLIAPAAPRRTIRETALAWRCDHRACKMLLKAATSVLEEAANTAASDACEYLFALYIAAPPVDDSEPASARAVFAKRQRRGAPAGLCTRDEFIEWLLSELDGAADRSSGTLRMPRSRERGPHSTEGVDSTLANG